MSAAQQLAMRRQAEVLGVGGTVNPVVSNESREAAMQLGQALAAPIKPAMITYIHQSAGANTIMPNGKKLVFGGKTGRAIPGGGWSYGGMGYYSTDLPEEISWLEDLVKSPTSQVTKLVEDPVNHTESVMLKSQDPAIAQSAIDAATNTARAMDPQVAAAQDNLAKTIAAGT